MTGQKMPELLPCPWCGEKMGEPVVIEGSTFRWRMVQGCCTDGPEVRYDTMSDDTQTAGADAARRAIEAWNARAPVASREQEGERVTDEMVEVCIKLLNLVEGTPIRKWVDSNGERLKDQPEWVKFYCFTKTLTAVLRAKG